VPQEHLIDALLTLATSEQGVELWEPVDLAALAQGIVLSFQQHTARQGIHIRMTFTEATATGDPRLLHSLITNLVDNALRHNHPDGQVEISTTSREGRAILAAGS
jgi:signal transduction histidine kinase